MKQVDINRYFSNDRLQTIPKKQKAKLALFVYLHGQLAEKGQSFSEKEINDHLKVYYDDYAILRRYLVDYGFLSRDNYGLEYHLNAVEDLAEE